ncbi:MAG: hypothetical protein IJ752_08720 [Alphaproteobacteria bacterium]|nr:hypothetical protein [Alphaproteobacteria bacterium]
MTKSMKEFCLGTYPIFDLMPSGLKNTQAGEKRRAIGFGRESETISRSTESLLLEKLGYRRAIGFGRENELIKNGPSGKETAAGFGRKNEPVAQPAKAVRPIGFKISRIRTPDR